jgi:hypothetical protein
MDGWIGKLVSAFTEWVGRLTAGEGMHGWVLGSWQVSDCVDKELQNRGIDE